MSFIPRHDDDERSLPLANFDDEDDGFVLNIPEEEPDKDDPKTQMEALRAENAALKARPTPRFEDEFRPVQQQQYQAPPTQQQQAPQFNDAQLDQEFILKPTETLRKVSQATYQMAEQNFSRQLQPMKAALVKQNIQYYKQTSGMDSVVSKKFDAIIKSIPDAELANVSPETIQGHLENISDMALAKAIKEGHVPDTYRRNSAPQYSGSRGSVAPPGMKQTKVKFTAAQEYTAKMAREMYGWDDKQIFEAFKNGDLG